jgi:phosphomevalonate kinase
MTRATQRGTPEVTAPGKVFLVGEYAVLEGGAAVVAAVSRRASGRFVAGIPPASPVVAEAVRLTAAALGRDVRALPAGAVLVDTGELSSGGRKLGLGSSAATAAVAVGAMLEAAGRSVEEERDLVFSIAEAAHRRAQGGLGSGADVAATVHGGLIRYLRPAGASAAPVIRRLTRLPPASELLIFSTGTPSSTLGAVKAMAALRERDPAYHEALLEPLRDAADRFMEAIDIGNARELAAATRAAGAGMAALGTAADLPIVTPELAAAAALAEELGGAAKPSGAGGGDVGVALFPEREAAHTFRRRACDLGLTILDIAVDPDGVSRRPAGA